MEQFFNVNVSPPAVSRRTNGLPSLLGRLGRKLTVLAMAVAGAFTASAQGTTPSAACDPACLGNVLNISTGYDQASGTYNSPLAIETNWTLVGVPASSGIILPAPAYDINPHPAWSNFPNAQWVSPFQNNSYNINNWPASQGAFTFELCFCVCDYTTIDLKFELMADDYTEVKLDGATLGSGYSGWHFQYANRIVVSQQVNLAPGRHCITVDLYNVFGVAMGFSLEGTVSGANLLTSACCNPRGRICGTKVQDVNCDGHIDLATDPGLPGWTINLYDQFGNYIGSQVTDAQGNYCFSPLAPGTYTVAEVNQPGWGQTFPPTGTHVVNVPPGGTITANFGNCFRDIPPPCDARVEAEFRIRDCMVKFTSLISGVPPGYNIVSTNWDFGDGTTSTELNPTHFYNAPGVYTVCLFVTLFNGSECCTVRWCKDIQIDKACDRGCDFKADMLIDFDPLTCTYDFTADVLVAGLPVTGYWWDFGDGTNASGNSVTHQFPGPGMYTVCLYLFGNDPSGRCCVWKVCKDIAVRCKPCNFGTTDVPPTKNKAITPTVNNIELTDNMVILNQNAPNPFAETTTISYDIPTNFSKAQIIFMNVDGKIIKTVEISQRGPGSINVFGDDLSHGVYMYSLVVDGRTIDSKRMLKK